ncbi:unnamed protein product [Amoebophrya sp. A120]|nr:unnamed protein product [Amoebophrya sp. A120]|eukprot:GSA120T00012094001.1
MDDILNSLWEWTQGNLKLYNPEANFYDDLQVVAVRVVVLLVARFCFAGAYHRELRKCPCLLDYVTKTGDYADLQKAKFFENLWYTMWHSSISAWTISLFLKEPWRENIYNYDLSVIFGNWLSQRASPEVITWYLWQLAFWISSLIYLFLEKRRKDFYMMLTHHLATCTLVFFSYWWNYWRIGLLVLLFHDAVDIFLYATKAGKDSLPRKITEILFVFFLLSYLVLRLILYPSICVYTAVRTGWGDIVDPVLKYLFDLKPFPVDREMKSSGAGFYSMPALLCVLQVLHILWFRMILIIAVKAIKASLHDTGDIRSESDISPANSPVPSKASNTEFSAGKEFQVSNPQDKVRAAVAEKGSPAAAVPAFELEDKGEMNNKPKTRKRLQK